MARGRSNVADMAREAVEGVTIDSPGALMPLDDADVETAWDEWGESLRTSDTGGKVRAYKLPQDEHGNPLTNAKGAKQTYLGAWEHQAYDFDSLLQMLTRKFLRPGESCYVRLTGVRSGSGGIQFNKIVCLQRDATAEDAPTGMGGDLSAVMQAVQKMNEQNAALMERLTARNEPAPRDPLVKEIALASIPVLGTVLAAWIGRPAPKSDLGELITALGKLKGFVGDNKSGESDDDSPVSIIKAIGPQALQLLNTLAQRNPQPLPAARRIPAQPVPPRRIQNPADSTATQTPAGEGGTSQAPAKPARPTAQTPSTQEAETMLAQLAPQLSQLAAMAENNEDPVEVAKLVLDSIPDDENIDAQLYAIISDEKAFGRLMLLAPQLKPHKEWFEKLRVALLAEFDAEGEESTTPSPTPA